MRFVRVLSSLALLFINFASAQSFKEALSLGGYLSIKAGIDDREREISLDEAALIVGYDALNWRFLMELEAEDPYRRLFGDVDEETTHLHVNIERLFVERHLTNDASIRVGQFFSPIGFWNTYPINVLRDTTSDPTFVDALFPRLSSGLLYTSVFDDGQWHVMIQPTEEIDDRQEVLRSKNHFYTSLDLYGDEDEWRIGAGYATLKDGPGRGYATLGWRRDLTHWTLLAEGGVVKREGDRRLFYDLYLQSVWHFADKHDAIVRLERFDLGDRDDTKGIFGYTWRPERWLACKGEWDWSAHEEARWLFSFSFLF